MWLTWHGATTDDVQHNTSVTTLWVMARKCKPSNIFLLYTTSPFNGLSTTAGQNPNAGHWLQDSQCVSVFSSWMWRNTLGPVLMQSVTTVLRSMYNGYNISYRLMTLIGFSLTICSTVHNVVIFCLPSNMFSL